MTKHPIEVITSVERRRRWSREGKERLVAACLEPGAVLSEIARAAGIHVSQLFRWHKELCQFEEPRLESASTLMPVIVSEAVTAIQPTATETPAPPQPHRKRSDVMIAGRHRLADAAKDLATNIGWMSKNTGMAGANMIPSPHEQPR
ncbi:transposase [Agrobacterium tumefaciens]|uniref:Transposase n=1 Tax=Agrobacterium tumefaciens TaxID=358 RepID=A0AA44FBI6_AGRTU|nr:transposase [Agrobacterium tumefaciens]NSL20212.1 IS66 family insertion sequence hypothetical protein [Agrobacterium tumefaciens]NTB88334.1 IS66 family insertion sequence hypothetical protein [Agrobacterium tumefaciens]NTC16041.1 IS66 family insertion sequence hypothetical protein [Agrobacterium tumefaciens]NTC32138.1 IS66 family insertion sequence hypothetical protein [Agrobacterium tumefaciens]NTC54643.1 IS66 family insertion sequence hypothetical protein [Agrobacterium tumefaciens]